jgi:hypothetical protein
MYLCSMKWFQLWLLGISIYNATGGCLALFYPQALNYLFPDATNIVANAMFFRVIGWWSLTTSIIRFATVIYPTYMMYVMTFLSFVFWQAFFLSEAVIFQTVQLHNVAVGLVLGFISIVWMKCTDLK